MSNWFDSVKTASARIRYLPLYIRNRIDRFWRKQVKGQHQLTSTTALNRYPELFAEVSANCSSKSEMKILSFGCSTGEECFTMKSYFPSARVLGVDINKRNLRKARASNEFTNVDFHLSTPKVIQQHGPYDVIFCLSVLCRWEDTKDVEDCSDIYSFEKFSETIKMLNSQLRLGGLFVIFNSNFRLEDASDFSHFEVISTPTVANSGFVHKFDRNNRRIYDEHRHCVYRKTLK